MGNLAVTIAQVQEVAGSIVVQGYAGEDGDAGEAVYLDAASNKWKLDHSGIDTSASQTGILQNSPALGQPCSVCIGGPIDLGVDADPTEGVVYGVSPTPGKITAVDDALMVAGEYVKVLGVGAPPNYLDMSPQSTDYTVQA